MTFSNTTEAVAYERRLALAELLRCRRDGLQPESLGIFPGARRRAKGLRREEVAAAAGLSVSWYSWLEQGRDVSPSRAAMNRIADVLRLTSEERTYAMLLAGIDVSALADCTTEATEEVTIYGTLLSSLTGTPALLYNERFDVLAANSAARSIYGSDVATRDTNMLRRFFVDADRRRQYPDALEDRGIRNLIGALRMRWAAETHGSAVQDFIETLRSESTEFDRVWRMRFVSTIASLPGRVSPRGSGIVLDVTYTRFLIPNSRNVIALLVPDNAQSGRALSKHLDRAV